jgi:hypothetical protein
MLTTLPPRAPWPDNFPDVIVHGDEKVRDAHPSYLAAKSRDAKHAIRLASDLLSSAKLAVTKLTLGMTYPKNGDEIDDFWIETFGHGIACLTEREAIAICRQHSLTALKTILAKAAAEVRAR